MMRVTATSRVGPQQSRVTLALTKSVSDDSTPTQHRWHASESSTLCETCRRAMDAGTPEEVHELRMTDIDEAKARQRYAVFKQHYGTLLRLKQYFPFSLIDGAQSGVQL